MWDDGKKFKKITIINGSNEYSFKAAGKLVFY